MWFDSFKEKVHSLTLPGWQPQLAGDLSSSADTIKIALLDTGAEFPPQLNGVGISIAESRSWLTDETNGVPIKAPYHQDSHGHGTHAAGLIKKIAPLTELYSAQIFDHRPYQLVSRKNVISRIANVC